MTSSLCPGQSYSTRLSSSKESQRTMRIACRVLKHGIAMRIACRVLKHGIAMRIACRVLKRGIAMRIACRVLKHGIAMRIACRVLKHGIDMRIACRVLKHADSVLSVEAGHRVKVPFRFLTEYSSFFELRCNLRRSSCITATYARHVLSSGGGRAHFSIGMPGAVNSACRMMAQTLICCDFIDVYVCVLGYMCAPVSICMSILLYAECQRDAAKIVQLLGSTHGSTKQ